MTNIDLKDELRRLHLEEGIPLILAAGQIGIGKNTAYRWAKAGGYAPRSQDRSKECRQCSKSFIPSRPEGTFCSRACTNEWQRVQAQDTIPICPCGEPIAYERRHYAKYCNDEHRYQYGPQGGPKKDPTNYKTFNCLTCDKEVTRYKKYGKGHLKYCSNECAQKLTKVKKHFAVDGFEIVFDSSYEAFFWGACMLAKIPIERFDRQYVVSWENDEGTIGGQYGPDFWLPTLYTAVEVKGFEDFDDKYKWAAYRATGKSLAVLDQSALWVAEPSKILQTIDMYAHQYNNMGQKDLQGSDLVV